VKEQPPPTYGKNAVLFARVRLGLAACFTIFGVVIVVQGLLRLRDHGPAVLPLLAMGGLLIAFGYVRLRQYRAVMRQL
jgi:hypothetical protein